VIPARPQAQPGQRGCAGGGRGQAPDLDNAELRAPVQGNVYMLVGGGGTSPSRWAMRAFCWSTRHAQLSDKILAEIRKLSSAADPATSSTPTSIPIMSGTKISARPAARCRAATSAPTHRPGDVIARERAERNERTDRDAGAVPFAWPTDTYFTKQKELFFNNEAVVVVHQPAAHTDGDSLVYFSRSDVVSTGDVFVTNSYPIIDQRRGGSINGTLQALNYLLDLAIPKDKQEGGTYIIPGHGRLCDEADLLEYRDMVTIIRDRIEDLVKKGRTLEQVKAAKPTLDYDGRYGSDSGPWTTAMFIEAVFRDLSRK
jgi:glyoxylase-like metal-dependent hydrolase (beta-lactamase superfamily II)